MICIVNFHSCINLEPIAMYNRPYKVLIADDDVDLVTLLTDYLTLEGFIVVPAHDGAQALEKLKGGEFDLMILDVMMPKLNGVEVLREIRTRGMTIPVLMLTAKGDPVDRILGLELGSDDYVPKPCPPRELVARMKAILRRCSGSEKNAGPISVGPLKVDLTHMRVSVNSVELSLTRTELELLGVLAREAGKPVSKSDIYPLVLGRPMGRFDRAIDVHISAIRHKLSEISGNPVSINSVRGIGYQLVVNEHSDN